MHVIHTPLSARLKASTHATHDRLDRSIMEAASFSSLDGYRRFLQVQRAFHSDIEAFYADPGLQALLPGLAERRRLPLIEADLADLGEDMGQALPGRPVPDPATALGWLYVAEGSNLGATLLRKEAARLGLSDAHGARHLAPAEEGPAAHWRHFKAGLDAAMLTDAEVERAVAGANAAFARVQALVDAELA
ncbi:biliverdin-producing heme oxygenase [Sphingomonas kyeonggiensis]|uniref:Heme oxygenase n=1 Tax=Sphingomonas kyeonggiensis TaxID=1268553 RepID=A0A7W6JVP8_9SPHN|nr:biliverdin-producing heme oxygenase [Sphingomonas kyeonggiensis]MBB4100406.1 heme oxygenase [Sphingomonas kyeonggiensis]